MDDLLKKFNMTTCKPMPISMGLNEKFSNDDESKMVDESLYRSLVGSLIYLTNTRLDIVHSIGVVSMVMSKPRKTHYEMTKNP